MSINQLYFIQPASSGSFGAVLFSRRAPALSICSFAKNTFMRGGNHAIGAPSALRDLKAAKFVVAVLAWFSRVEAFDISPFEASILSCLSFMLLSMVVRLR